VIDQLFIAMLVFTASAVVFLTRLSNSCCNEIRSTSSKVEYAQIFNKHLNLFLSDVVDVKTDVKGYLISNDETFPEPMIKSEDDLLHSMSGLLWSKQDNNIQIAKLNTLEILILEKIQP
jgi:CHASE3 domain sensor protein